MQLYMQTPKAPARSESACDVSQGRKAVEELSGHQPKKPHPVPVNLLPLSRFCTTIGLLQEPASKQALLPLFCLQASPRSITWEVEPAILLPHGRRVGGRRCTGRIGRLEGSWRRRRGGGGGRRVAAGIEVVHCWWMVLKFIKRRRGFIS